MALRYCNDCGRPVSQSAPACPNCGRPFSAAPVGRHVQTIQATGKDWKFLIVIAYVGAFVGCMMLIVNAATHANAPRNGLIVLASSVGLYLIAKVGAWWNHA